MQGANSTLLFLAKQAATRAKTASALGLSPTATAAPLKPKQPGQPAKTQDISPDEDMLRASRDFLRSL